MRKFKSLLIRRPPLVVAAPMYFRCVSHGSEMLDWLDQHAGHVVLLLPSHDPAHGRRALRCEDCRNTFVRGRRPGKPVA